MNERILQLADKVCENMPTPSWYIPDEFCQKFAEKIIRECAQFVEDKFDFVGDEIIVKEKMLEHFGIKE